MFNKHVLEVLKHNDRVDPFNSYGEHSKMRTMVGGIRYEAHPTPEMDFQPDTLYTGEELYDDIKPRLTRLSKTRRYIGGMGQRVHHGFNGLDERGGSLKSFGRSLSRGFKKLGKDLAPVGKALAPVAKYVGKEIVAPVVKDFATTQGRKFLAQQLGKFAIQDALPVAEEAAPLMLAAGRGRMRGCGMVGGAKKPSGKREARGQLIKKIMREHGCNLAEASRYIKEHGIKY